jgi:hypothetical protein
MTPKYFIGKGYTEGLKSSDAVTLNDFKFVNTTFENDGGHIYIDGGPAHLTNFVFENCKFGRATRPGDLMGDGVGLIVFKNVRMNGAVLRNGEQLKRAGYEVYVPVKFEP